MSTKGKVDCLPTIWNSFMSLKYLPEMKMRILYNFVSRSMPYALARITSEKEKGKKNEKMKKEKRKEKNQTNPGNLPNIGMPEVYCRAHKVISYLDDATTIVERRISKLAFELLSFLTGDRLFGNSAPWNRQPPTGVVAALHGFLQKTNFTRACRGWSRKML